MSTTPIQDMFPTVPVTRSGLTFDGRAAEGPALPEVVLELSGLRVLRYADGTHLIEQSEATPRFDMFAREFGEIRKSGINRVLRGRRHRDDTDGYEDD